MISPTRGAGRRTGRTGVLLGLGLVSVLIALVAVPACSNYSEGERCQSENGDDDCQSGLTCTPAVQLSTTSDRCCPVDRNTATETVCKVAVGATGTANDAAASADTGISTASDASTTSDASDASSDAPSDG